MGRLLAAIVALAISLGVEARTGIGKHDRAVGTLKKFLDDEIASVRPLDTDKAAIV